MKFDKWRKILPSACVVCILIFLSAGSPPTSNSEIPDASKRINAFTFALLKRVAGATNAPINAILSAQSIYHGLAMSYLASGGTTRQELAAVLRFPADNEQLVRSMADLRRQLEVSAAHRRTEVSMATSLWLDATHADFRRDYTDLTSTAFDASLYAVQFRDQPRTSDAINRWVASKTHDKISRVVEARDFASRSRPGVIDEPALLGINAACFKADWGNKFEKQATHLWPFRAPNSTHAVMSMAQRALLSYAEDEQVQFLELPYIDGLFSMYVILPKAVLPVSKLRELLDADRIAKLEREAVEHNVDVLFPKFELTSHLGAREILEGMGVNAAFDSRSANFDKMINKKLEAFRVYLSEIYHDAWVTVHEEGTEAAAATTSMHFSIGCSAPRVSPSAVFRADHPFLFLIVHKESRSVLFGGWVSQPGDNGVKR